MTGLLASRQAVTCETYVMLHAECQWTASSKVGQMHLPVVICRDWSSKTTAIPPATEWYNLGDAEDCTPDSLRYHAQVQYEPGQCLSRL